MLPWLEVVKQLRTVVTCASDEYHDSVAALEGSPQVAALEGSPQPCDPKSTGGA
jgi:hypothetical protein